MLFGIFYQVNDDLKLFNGWISFVFDLVLLCTVVTGLCFWTSELIYDIQDRNRSKNRKKS